MNIVNEITMEILRKARDGESIHSLASKIGYAYSAVYKWIVELERYGVINLVRKGNKNVIMINKNMIYKKFLELDCALSVIEKDNRFWEFMKSTRLKIRFVKGSAVSIWTKGGYITGDFYDRIYFLEVDKKEINKFKECMDKEGIAYTEGKISKKRPLIWIEERKDFKVEKKGGLSVMPLKELVEWAKELHLDGIIEQLDLLYNLGLNVKYAEVGTNV